MPRTFRVLPPGGGFASPYSLLSASLQLRQSKRQDISTKQILKRALQSAFGCESTIVTGSGKEAIYLIAEAHKKKHQLKNPICNVSAFTCPDVASALLKAGYKLRLFDVDQTSLEPIYPIPTDREVKGEELLLLSNLFGFPDKRPKTNSFIIDDACQAGLSYLRGERVGSRGDAGVLSFGRGKAFPGPGGGAILLNSALEIDSLPAISRKHLFSQTAKMFLLWALQTPQLYRLPVSLPFLHLGQTEFLKDLSREPSRRGASLSAFVQLGNSQSRSSVFTSNSYRWEEALAGLELRRVFNERHYSPGDRISPIRYPVIFPNKETRDRAWKEFQLEGLGATCSYPAALSDYPQLADSIVSSSDDGAKIIADTLLTLPVHRYVKQRDIERTVKILKLVL